MSRYFKPNYWFGHTYSGNLIFFLLQMITADQLGEVYEKLNKGNDSVVRYVLDIKASNWRDEQKLLTPVQMPRDHQLLRLELQALTTTAVKFYKLKINLCSTNFA